MLRPQARPAGPPPQAICRRGARPLRRPDRGRRRTERAAVPAPSRRRPIGACRPALHSRRLPVAARGSCLSRWLLGIGGSWACGWWSVRPDGPAAGLGGRRPSRTRRRSAASWRRGCGTRPGRAPQSVPLQPLPRRPAPAGDPAAGRRRREPARDLRPRARATCRGATALWNLLRRLGHGASGSSRCSGCSRAGWRRRPRRSATTTWSSSAPTAPGTPATCWISPAAAAAGRAGGRRHGRRSARCSRGGSCGSSTRRACSRPGPARGRRRDARRRPRGDAARGPARRRRRSRPLTSKPGRGRTPPGRKPSPETCAIRGQVVGPDGKPFAGATVIASRVRPRLDPRRASATEYDRRPAYESCARRPTRTADSRSLRADRTTFTGTRTRPIRRSSRRPPASAWATTSKDRADPAHRGRRADRRQAGRPRRAARRRASRSVSASHLPAADRGAGQPPRRDEARARRPQDSAWTRRRPAGRARDRRRRPVPDRGAGPGRAGRPEALGPDVALKQVKCLTASMDRVAEEPRDADFAGLDEPARPRRRLHDRRRAHPADRGDGPRRRDGTPIPGAAVTAGHSPARR